MRGDSTAAQWTCGWQAAVPEGGRCGSARATRHSHRGEAPSRLTLDYEIGNPPPPPPGLRLDSPARAVIEFSGSGATARCSLGIRVTLEGEPCVLPLAVWTRDRHAYWRMREAARLPAFRGDVSSSGTEWSLALSGRRAFLARPGPPDGAAPRAEPEPPWLAYKYALAADWTKGPLAEGPVQLWSIRPESSAPAVALTAGACETAGDLGGWLTRLVASGPVAAMSGGVPAASIERFEREVGRSEFEPFAFRIYEGGSFGVPPDTGLATTRALDAYRRRREIRLSGLVIVSVDCYANPAVIEGLLPPPCIAGRDSALRVLRCEVWMTQASTRHGCWQDAHLRVRGCGTQSLTCGARSVGPSSEGRSSVTRPRAVPPRHFWEAPVRSFRGTTREARLPSRGELRRVLDRHDAGRNDRRHPAPWAGVRQPPAVRRDCDPAVVLPRLEEASPAGRSGRIVPRLRGQRRLGHDGTGPRLQRHGHGRRGHAAASR